MFSSVFSVLNTNMSQGEIQEIAYLENNAQHRTYLVTYSQLDYRKFPARWSFGGAVVATFGANNVDYFVAAKKSHETSSTRYHYHVALRLIKPMRWKTAKSHIFENDGATVSQLVVTCMLRHIEMLPVQIRCHLLAMFLKNIQTWKLFPPHFSKCNFSKEPPSIK